MKAVVQRVKRASVTVDGKITGACDKGLAILLGVAQGDTEEDAILLAQKIAKMRIFCDENDKMNLSVIDVDGGAVVVSQFTLLANYKKGNRPDYLFAASPDEANRLYEFFIAKFEEAIGKSVGRGVFGAHMEYEIINDGPVTIVMESDILKKRA